MNFLQRAAQNLPLTPGERAFLKLLKNWLYSAIGTGLLIGGQAALSTNGAVDWLHTAYVAGGAVTLSLLTALDKWFMAQGDSPLAQGAAVTIQAVEKQVSQVFPSASAGVLSTAPAGVASTAPPAGVVANRAAVVPSIPPALPSAVPVGPPPTSAG